MAVGTRLEMGAVGSSGAAAVLTTELPTTLVVNDNAESATVLLVWYIGDELGVVVVVLECSESLTGL